ncbi:hypothetical protein BDP55DRAFT_750669 [Colletotrichum godetiae]|uniref:Uncharacterized protein n=1 Tax=Colletotrichum godetiae TaxID=1209918 RepID=A0AAJ0AH59_9PEZI|nr:uncharacterized protein BDP55DRAFT_750669 [Colletotrichum godetiae]KAK1672272.1 hypothetical protein BDP55DRAFT_750669 [Colletotrichum godetiae]
MAVPIRMDTWQAWTEWIPRSPCGLPTAEAPAMAAMAAMFLSVQPVKFVMPVALPSFPTSSSLKSPDISNIHFLSRLSVRDSPDQETARDTRHRERRPASMFQLYPDPSRVASSRSSLRPNPCHLSVNHIPHPRSRSLSFFCTVVSYYPSSHQCRFSCNNRIRPHYALNRLTSSASPPSRHMALSPPVLLPAYLRPQTSTILIKPGRRIEAPATQGSCSRCVVQPVPHH